MRAAQSTVVYSPRLCCGYMAASQSVDLGLVLSVVSCQSFESSIFSFPT